MSGLAALALTLAVEVPLYVLGLILLRLAGPVRAIALGVGVNLLTHPVLWHVLAPAPTVPKVLLAEAGVCVVEAAVIWLVVRRDTVLVVALGVGVNAASFGAGLLLSRGFAG